MIRLVVREVGQSTFEHVSREPVEIGRARGCHVVLTDRFLSRRHARVFSEGRSWYVEDLGSRNGTRLNGAPVGEASVLRTGDRIELSRSLIEVKIETDEPSSSAVADGPHQYGLRDATEFLAASEFEAPRADESNQHLQRLADRLTVLNRLHHELWDVVDLEKLLERVLDIAFDLLAPEEGEILLRRGGRFERVLRRAIDGVKDESPVSETLINEVAGRRRAARVLDLEKDERFQASKSLIGSGVRSLIAAPLIVREGSLGMIALRSQLHRKEFSEADLALLVNLASISALRIRNLELADAQSERQRLERELELAREIQVALLPESLPSIDGYELHATAVPSRKVSGDFYEVVSREAGEKTLIVVADVSGKGVAAALLTASLEALLGWPIAHGASVDSMCTQVSSLLFKRTPPAKYAALFAAELDTRSGSLYYAAAGHIPAAVVHQDGSVTWLRATGFPLGLIDDSQYGLESVELGYGDLLVVCTDGITEATSAEGEEFGSERLVALCSEHSELELTALSAEIERTVDAFSATHTIEDDRTLLLLRRSEASGRLEAVS